MAVKTIFKRRYVWDKCILIAVKRSVLGPMSMAGGKKKSSITKKLKKRGWFSRDE